MRHSRAEWWDGQRRFCDALVDYTADCRTLGPRAIAQIIHGVASSGLRSREVEDMLVKCVRQMQDMLDRCDTQNVCNSLWGLATYGGDDQVPKAAGIFKRSEVVNFFRAVDAEKVSLLNLDDSNAGQNVSNAIWSFGKAGYAAPGMLAELTKQIDSHGHSSLGSFRAQQITNTVWGIAILFDKGHAVPGAERFFAAVAASLCDRAFGDVQSFHLCTIAWAFAKVGHAAPYLFQLIIEKFVPSKVDARGISQLVWAFSTSKYPSSELYVLLARPDVLPPRLHELNTQNLSMVAWAYANAECWDSSLFEAVAREAKRRWHRFSEQQIATTIWALGKFRPTPPPAACDSLLEIARMLSQGGRSAERLEVAPIEQWTPGHLSMSLYGFAMADIKHAPLYAAYKRACEPLVHKFSDKEIAMVSWSFVGRCTCPSGLLEAGVHKFDSANVDGMGARPLSMMLWAQTAGMAMDRHMRSETFGPFIEKAAKRTLVVLGDFDAQSLAHLAIGFANASEPHWSVPIKRQPSVDWVELARAISGAASVLIDKFTPSELGTLMFAVAVLIHTDLHSADSSDHHFMEQCSRKLLMEIENLSGQLLAQVAWALASTRTSAEAVFDRIERCAVLSSFGPRAISRLAFAFASHSAAPERMLRSINDMFIARFDGWAATAKVDGSTDLEDAMLTPRHVADLAIAFAQHPQCAAGLYERLTSWASTHLGEFGQNNLVHMLAGFAKASHAPPATFAIIADERIAELRKPPCSGFTESQEARLGLWNKWRAQWSSSS